MSEQELQTKRDMDQKVKHWKTEITKAWSKSIESIVNVGKRLLEAKQDIANDEKYEELERSLPFSASVASNLRVIAEHPVLSNRRNFGKLPAYVNTLYYLAFVPEETLVRLLEEGKVSVYTKLAEAKKLARKHGDRVNDPTKSISPRFEDMMEVGLIAIPKEADIEEFIPALDAFLATYQAKSRYTKKQGSLADRYREIIREKAEDKIEETQGALGDVTLDQVRMLDQAARSLSQRGDDGKGKEEYPQTEENYQAIRDLIGTEVTKDNIRKWCAEKKVPNYLRVNHLEHEVYVWDLLRTYANEEDGYKTLKLLEKISERDDDQGGVNAAAKEALSIAMKFENERKPRTKRAKADQQSTENGAE